MVSVSKNAKFRIIIPYFGEWPEWMSFFLASCSKNKDFEWILPSDCGPLPWQPDNVYVENFDLAEFFKIIFERLGFDPEISRDFKAYKICDFKPIFGELFPEWLDGCSHWGFGDLDVIYGNLSDFIPPPETFDIFSTHSDRISAHFCLIRNAPQQNSAWKEIHNVLPVLQSPAVQGHDEQGFWNAMQPPHPSRIERVLMRCRLRSARKPRHRIYAVEQHSTILSACRPWHDGSREFPSEWYWKDGSLFNNKDGDRSFMYLHFMNWKTTRWLIRELGDSAPWEKLDTIANGEWDHLSDGFRLNRKGIFALMDGV